jgi:hypothetical protein
MREQIMFPTDHDLRKTISTISCNPNECMNEPTNRAFNILVITGSSLNICRIH